MAVTTPTLLDRAPTPRTRAAVGALFLVSLLVFVALAPVAGRYVGAYPQFVPVNQAVLVMSDLITAVMLFAQVRVTRSRAMLVLACAYLFAALIATAHLMSFPGALAPAGLLGGGPQTTAYLFVFWHAGFPLAVIGYIVLKTHGATVGPRPAREMAFAASCVLLLVAALAWIAVAGTDRLPPLLSGNTYSTAFNVFRHGQWALAVAAMALLWRHRPHCVLDHWLMVVLLSYCLEIGLAAVFNQGRYDIGFYAGRVYALLASTLVLVMLLLEHARLHDDVALAHAATRDAAAQREFEARFHTVLDGIPQLAWVARADGWIEWYNGRWYEYTGTTPQQMQGWGWQEVHDPVELPRVMAAWQQSIASGEPFEMVFPLRGADGSFRPFLTRVLPLRDAQGVVQQWLGTNTDITAQVQAQELLAEADRRKDVFIATLSHELRNPLAPIRTAVELMLRGPALPAPAPRALAIIDRQSRQLVRLVNDLLEVSRISRGKLRLQRAPCDLHACVDDAIATASAGAQAAGVTLEREPAAEALPGAFDSARIVQALTNLLTNAVKFSPPGSVVQVSAGRIGDMAQVRVSDDGRGIAGEHLEAIFDMFTQLGDDQQGGLGIGLALVRSLVEMHGGSVRAHSDGPGLGAEFVVLLPLQAAVPASPMAAAPASAAGSAAA